MNGNYKIGWFLDDSDNLHGYGFDSEEKTVGLFENNEFKFNDYDVTSYLIEKDIIAEKIIFDVNSIE